MAKVIDLNKERIVRMVQDKDEIQENEFEKERDEFIQIYEEGEWELVARNDIDARAISDILMELDDEISHVEIILCYSRKSTFFKINPIMKSGKEIRFCSNKLALSYIDNLIEIGLAEFVEDEFGGYIILKEEE